MNIFISHAEDERDNFENLHNWIKDTFEDMKVLPFEQAKSSPEKTWLNKLLENVKASELMIVVSSRSAMRSPWVWLEIGCGLMHSLEILPLCTGDYRLSDLPYPLSSCHGVDALNKEEAPKMLEVLKKWNLTEKSERTKTEKDFRDKIINPVRSKNAIYKRIFRSVSGWLISALTAIFMSGSYIGLVLYDDRYRNHDYDQLLPSSFYLMTAAVLPFAAGYLTYVFSKKFSWSRYVNGGLWIVVLSGALSCAFLFLTSTNYRLAGLDLNLLFGSEGDKEGHDKLLRAIFSNYAEYANFVTFVIATTCTFALGGYVREKLSGQRPARLHL